MDEDNVTTVEDVRRFLAYIAGISGDDEAAHAAEDSLHRRVLYLIASGQLSGRDAIQAAAEALKSKHIEFCRWCA